MDIFTYKQAANFVNDLIPSASLKQFIFGVNEVSHHDIKGIGSINKVLTAEFLLIYFKWLNSERNELRAFYTPHFKKAEAVMNALYKGQRFNLDVITYVLAEAYKDAVQYGDNSFFFDMIDSSVKCEFGKMYSLIDEWKTNLQTSEPLVETILTNFVSAVSVSKALSKSDFINDTTNNSAPSFILYDEPLDTKNVIYIDKIGNRYVLVDKSYEKDDALYHYIAIDDFNQITVIKKADRR